VTLSAPRGHAPAGLSGAGRRSRARRPGGAQSHIAGAGFRPDVHARFQAIVARTVERVDRELAEHLVALRPRLSNRRRGPRAMRGRMTPGRVSHD
jgi:hypothetical protein